MDLKQLAALRAVAETGSFQRAAARLSRTQSAVSQQIKGLEEELGQTLVLRSRPRVSLSDAGRRVLATGQRILSEVEALSGEFSGARGEPGGELRIACSPLGIVYLYGELIGAFISQHPKVEVTVTATASGREGERHVLARTADAAFTAFSRDSSRFRRIVLGTAEHVLIAARGHPLSAFRSVPLTSVRQHRFVRYLPGAGSRMSSDALFLAKGGYPPILAESNDTEFIKRIVKLGLAVAIVPGFTVLRQKDRELAVIRIEGRSLQQEFGLVYRADTRLRALASFCEFCRQRAGRLG